MALRQQPPDVGGVPVRVAVHPPARRVDRRVHDLGVREVGPLGAREVDRRDLRECERSLARPPGAPLPVQLLLVDVVELAVVVEQAH